MFDRARTALKPLSANMSHRSQDAAWENRFAWDPDWDDHHDGFWCIDCGECILCDDSLECETSAFYYDENGDPHCSICWCWYANPSQSWDGTSSWECRGACTLCNGIIYDREKIGFVAAADSVCHWSCKRKHAFDTQVVVQQMQCELCKVHLEPTNAKFVSWEGMMLCLRCYLAYSSAMLDVTCFVCESGLSNKPRVTCKADTDSDAHYYCLPCYKEARATNHPSLLMTDCRTRMIKPVVLADCETHTENDRTEHRVPAHT